MSTDSLNVETNDLAMKLTRAVRGRVRFDSTTRALYSADASNYRHIPIGLVAPVDRDDVLVALEICRAASVAVLPRGAGTSIAGQAVNTAVVFDYTRHMNQVLDIDAASATARVQPGVILDALQHKAAPHGLVFGPDPSTHSRCTVGGMIGNNACGAHSVTWGKTVDNVEALDVVTYDGTCLSVGPTGPADLARLCEESGRAGEIYRALRDLRDRYGSLVESSFPDLTRRVSGYNLDQLLDANGFNLARALVGTEGTCATTLEATVRLFPAPGPRALAVLGFPDAFAAADQVMAVLAMKPLAVEGMDENLIAALAASNPAALAAAPLPTGKGWLYVEMAADTVAAAHEAAASVARHMEAVGATSVVVSDPAAMALLWRIREDGAGISTRLPGGGEAWPGWEDAAVPPAQLGSYLRRFAALLDEHHLRGAYYGHFGDGCVHVRINFDLLSEAGVRGFRRFMEEAADLVVAHGGSLSGEHGDGQARAELLTKMYPPEILSAFADFKRAWDPTSGMNPGTIVEPRRMDDDLRVRTAPARIDLRTSLAFAHDGGSFATATRRCMGVGRCVTASGGVMCPSWRATGEEKHSTRGRARLLFEMANGEVIEDGWRSEEVRDALDLCLSCKGCKRDCPVGVDMASYKAEFLSKHYAGRRRPASHYSMGFLPLWLRAGTKVAGLANAVSRRHRAAAVLKRLGGVAPERAIPELAPESFVSWFSGRAKSARGRRVVLLPDTFTNFFDPAVGKDAVAVLEALGYAVEVPTRPVCCGLTWMSTGQLGVAKRVLSHTLGVLKPWIDAGVPVVGLEPSCTAMLRVDSLELVGDSPLAAKLAGQVRTFAEIVNAEPERWPEPLAALNRPSLTTRAAYDRAIVQMHCHQHADLGFGPDRAVMAGLGVDANVLDSGCCGLAGNFGFEQGHYEVSMACAERVLLPAVRTAGAEVAVVADGYSCRTQIRQSTDRRPIHLAQLMAANLCLPSPD